MNENDWEDEHEVARLEGREEEECDGCQWWSELCAQSIGCGPIDALCLNSDSIHYQKMIHCGCQLYKFGKSIDCPC